MKTKVGTVLEEDLLRRARTLAAREGKRLSRVLEEALSEHLDREQRRPGGDVVGRTAGMLRAPRRVVERILREEPGLWGE